MSRNADIKIKSEHRKNTLNELAQNMLNGFGVNTMHIDI